MPRFVRVETGPGPVWVNPEQVHFIVQAMSVSGDKAVPLLGHTGLQLTGQSEMMIVKGNHEDIAIQMSDDAADLANESLLRLVELLEQINNRQAGI